MSYLTESERRSAGAKRAAQTRKLNAQREAQRLQDALYARQKIDAERKKQAPIIEAERAANKAQWLHYWRSQIGGAVTQDDLNTVIKELADWGGYGGGFGSTFDPPVQQGSNQLQQPAFNPKENLCHTRTS